MARELLVRTAYLQYEENEPVWNRYGYKFIFDDNEEEIFVPKSFIDNILDQDDIYIEHEEEIIKLILRNQNHITEVQEGAMEVAGCFSEPTRAEWTETNTKYLSSLYKSNKDNFKMKKKLWSKITEEMNAKGHKFSNVQVENWFKTLERAYKSKTSNDNMSGRGKKDCPYVRELNEIFLRNPCVFPEVTATASTFSKQTDLINKSGVLREAVHTTKDREDTNDEESCLPYSTGTNKQKGVVVKRSNSESQQLSKKKRACDILTQLQNDFQNMESAAQTRHTEKIVLMKERNILLEKKNNLLERLLEKRSLDM